MRKSLLKCVALCALMASCCDDTVTYNRGLGQYPGNPSESFAPKMISGGGETRNLAHLRQALASSAADCNQTAQLVTDGLVSGSIPDSLSADGFCDGSFYSAWVSASSSEEWIYVDLGAVSEIDKVELCWINQAISGMLSISDDAQQWTAVCELTDLGEAILDAPVQARYVRLDLGLSEDGNQFVLSEFRVIGRGGLLPQACKSPEAGESEMLLSGGNWRLQRSTEVKGNGQSISSVGFNDKEWVVATVPSTVLSSYLNIGALPDPNYSDNQLQISDSYFRQDFWYRNEFDVPQYYAGKNLTLEFDGINWLADVFVNGQAAGRIEGAFMRGSFDVTDLLEPGKTNAIAVLVHKNDSYGEVSVQTAENAGPNGGVLGGDNPTFHASIGWDWMPTIRGRNMGIWNDVRLCARGSVTIIDPFVRSTLNLPATDKAYLTAQIPLRNETDADVSGTLKFRFGKEVSIDLPVTLPAFGEITVTLDSDNFAQMVIDDPELWWPAGYGEQNLYNVSISFEVDGKASDSKSFKSGIRQMTFNEDGGILNMYVNGRRFVGKGGNWGFSESNLNYRAREYDIAVRYHADMNFTMIRNWVGQTGDEEFYDACDRYGIMVWQDFWLANPYDGPNPLHNDMFIANAEDYIKRIRNHPSIAIYVGRNEGNPPQVLDDALRGLTASLHPGIKYISHSAAGVVSGGGPYRALPPVDYFRQFGNDRFHSERGMPNVMNYENLARTLPADRLWPQNSLWGLHDFTMGSAQQGSSFNRLTGQGFGMIDGAERFTEMAQWINYDGYRAIFEGRSDYRQGMLLWMSHPAWPSMVWQTYDYYFEPTAAYFGCKKACEPLHIQMNPLMRTIEVVNTSAGRHKGMTAKAVIVNMDGTTQWQKECKLDCDEDSTVSCFALQVPETVSETYFLKLTLTEDGDLVSDNFYWCGMEQGNYRALRNLAEASVSKSVHLDRQGDEWKGTVRLRNDSDVPALMFRIKVCCGKCGDLILPVMYEDNYFSLLPGESKTVELSFSNLDTHGEKPEIKLSAYNVTF